MQRFLCPLAGEGPDAAAEFRLRADVQQQPRSQQDQAAGQRQRPRATALRAAGARERLRRTASRRL